MISDLQFALRQFRKSPITFAVLVLSLGLGIGCVSVVLCWMQGLTERPLSGVAEQSDIIVLVSNQGGGNISLPDARDFDQLSGAFRGLAASQITPASLAVDRQTTWTYGQVTTANFFELLGVRAIHGRTFAPQEDLKPGGNPVLVISERLWRSRFQSDRTVIGRVVELNRHAFTIIGVVPESFQGTMVGLACEFWAPISMYDAVSARTTDSLSSRSSRGFHNIGRLKAGVTLAQAQVAVVAKDLELESLHRSNREVRHEIRTYGNCPYGAQALLSPLLNLEFAVSLGVLLIVIANVANLQLARATARQKEIAVRMAAGSSRWQIVRLLLVENLVLATLGGVLGGWLASWGVDAVRWLLPETPLPIGLHFQLDPATILLTAGLSLGAGIVVGLAPALSCARTSLSDVLKTSGRSVSGSHQHNRLRRILAVTEMSLAIVLLIAAIACVNGLRKARQIPVGFDSENVLLSGLQIGMHGYNQDTGRVFYRELQARLQQTPEIESAALASWLPLGFEGCKGHGVTVKGYVRAPGENPTFEYSVVSPGYFATMRTRLLDGREFSEADDRQNQRVAVVNQAFARKFWPGQNALGQVFRVAGEERTIVGIVETGKYNRLSEDPWPVFFLPYQQYVPDLDLRVVVRAKGGTAQAAAAVRRVVQGLDPELALYGTTTLAGHMEAAFFPHTVATTLVTGLGFVALFLAVLGVYSIMSYMVEQRIPEFGIRLALGAARTHLLWSVQRQGILLALIAVAVGLCLAFVVTRSLAGLLYGITPFDPVAFLSVPVLMTAATMLACWLPALRASRLDPMVVLRAN